MTAVAFRILHGSSSQAHKQSSDELLSGTGVQGVVRGVGLFGWDANARRRLRSVPTAKVASSAAAVS